MLWALVALIGLAVVAVPTIWIASLHANFGVPASASRDGDQVVHVWRMLVVMSIAVCLVVMVLLVIALVTGARRKVASQNKGNIPLEVVYTGIPVLLVAAIFGASLWLEHRVHDVTRDPSLTVKVDAFRWGWRFTYPNGKQVVGATAQSDPVLVLPVDQTTRLILHSDDVIHSFFVPAFVTKLDVIPGTDNDLPVHPTVIGDYVGHCAEFCGLDHARMNFHVSVRSADEFDRWLANPTEGPP
jgi:cytochrome c oxidase subunit 2